MHSFLRLLNRLLFIAICVLGVARPAAAISCHLEVGGAQMVFNRISLLESGVKTAMATITYGCSGVSSGRHALVCISVGAGPDASYDLRYLREGSKKLGFNLYKDASLSTIWGSIESGGSPGGMAFVLKLPGDSGATATVPIYGGISTASQAGLSAGWYDTAYLGNWPIRIDYMEIHDNAPATCASPFTGTATSRFYIQAQVANDCRIDGTTPMDFGVVAGGPNQALQAQSTVGVTCNSTAYRVGLDNGLHAQDGKRRMHGPGGYVVYDLYQDAAHSRRWGNNLWYDAVGGTGTGHVQALTVYGLVPAQTITSSGSYSDTIVVTVDY
ncbi:MAG TPA: spore coat protein U domain-containing protein [Burkholderiaceae bacterium]|nr:spore coat protein U domain-containing protein [Burkholderiaceae bacterium]